MAVGSLVVRASDSRLEGLGSMPDATKYPPSTLEYVLVKSVGSKSCGLSHEHRKDSSREEVSCVRTSEGMRQLGPGPRSQWRPRLILHLVSI
ncbi:hypothetical protein TNCV_3404651 [Trichonephila clavipes]|nr:hypothetical protein TNCV_3404651 [Trichonephila clavipes]